MARKKRTTPEEFEKIIAEIIETESHDEEACHSSTDAAMEELLRELGYGKAIDLIIETERWCG